MAKQQRKSSSENEKQALIDVLVGASSTVGGKPASPAEMIEHLQEQGYRIVREDPAGERKQVGMRIDAAERYAGVRTAKFGVVSDTHLCSRKQQLSFLNAVYDRMVERGITQVLHGGDLVDGDGRVYPGQEFDVFAHGYDRQLSYATEYYPYREGVKTYVISGNHDWSFYQRKGADLLSALAERRSDIVYLGPMAARVPIEGGIGVQLIHLKAGITYARSYKIQKIIEQLAPEQKSEILLAGDRHSWAHLAMYRNVYAWQLGCFQAQTEWEKRLGLYPEIGGLIIEVDYGSKRPDRPSGIVAIRHEILPLYVPVEKDY